MKQQIIDLNTFASGALAERTNIELQKVLENIADPNTDHKKTRKVTINIVLKANEKRNLASVIVDAKSSLVPAKGIESEIIIDYNTNGSVTGAELKSGIPGQMYVDDNGDVLTDRGETIENETSKSSKVVNFK